MNSQAIREQAIKFRRSRANLAAVFGFTIANLVLTVLDVDLAFVFSAFVPELIYIILMDAFPMAGFMAGVLAASVYLGCYVFSKHKRGFIVAALVLFIIDTLIMLLFALMGGFAGFMINIAFSAWILFYLVTGTIAWAKLMDVKPDDFKQAAQELAQAEQSKEADAALRELSQDEEKSEDNKDEE